MEKKIYVVTQGCYSDYGIERIFSTRELAEEFINGQPEKDYGARIEEWDLDQPNTEIYRQVWSAQVGTLPGKLWGEDIRAGEIRTVRSDWKVAPRNVRVGHLSEFNYENVGRICVESFVSQEHANKLAAEAYQAWLRAGKPTTGWEVEVPEGA